MREAGLHGAAGLRSATAHLVGRFTIKLIIIWRQGIINLIAGINSTNTVGEVQKMPSPALLSTRSGFSKPVHYQFSEELAGHNTKRFRARACSGCAVWGNRVFSRVVGRLDKEVDVRVGGWIRHSATARCVG